MKRFMSCFLCIIIFAVGLSVSAEAAPTVSLICPTSVNSEEIFDVYATITENSNVGGGRITIGYDNTVLEIVSISAGELLSDVTLQSNTAYGENLARVSWAGVNNITSTGNLVKFTFKAKTIYTDTDTNIYIDDLKLTDVNAKPISATFEAVSTTIKGKSLPTFSVISSDEMLIGSNVDVEVSISENSLACGGRIDLVYDNTKFEVVSANAGIVISGMTSFVNSSYTSDTIRLSWAGTAPITSSGSILTVSFKVITEEVSSSEFKLQSCKMTDNNGASVQCATIGKLVNIVSTLKCLTKTTYSEVGNQWKFVSEIENCPSSAMLIVAIYKDGRLVDMNTAHISNENNKDIYVGNFGFDVAKVMVWESTCNLKPIADVEIVMYE